MSDIYIYVDKRAFTWTLLVLIGMGVVGALLFWQQPAAQDISPQVQALEDRVQQLSADNAALEKELNQTKRQIALEEEALAEREDAVGDEPEPVEEPAPELSGEIVAIWNVDMEDDKLDRVLVTIKNEKDTAQTLGYRVYWDDPDLSKAYFYNEVTIDSGKSHSRFIVNNGEGEIPTRVPSTVDTLILLVTDSDGNQVKRLEEDVR